MMSLGWDPMTAQVVIGAYFLDEVDEDDETDGAARADAGRHRPELR
ncbi:hypothetical protein [Arthrobacter zhaoxinii]